ncbi:zinc-dependent peptidase [Flavobacterium sp. DGU11]|uniref:Zinc-dependent peptidase n=1 Tax=Flavobacterium arundinis TaxID=3139143 RepID=A0ABU9HUS7_9FLAO
MELFFDTLFLIFILLLVIWALYFIFTNIIESAWMIVFDRPLYVHFYPFPKELPSHSRKVLEDNFSFYRNLSERRKKFFSHRIYNFIKKYRFLGRGGLEVSDDMQLKIAATWVMLTFGMRKYLTSVFNTIIIFPDIFESQNGNWHKGEFNPAGRVVVFSWKHFAEGIAFDTDNLNLGLHEFAHVLHVDSVGIRRPGASGIIYKDMFGKVLEYLDNPNNRQNLLAANYFRDYAYTNSLEFMAVVLEYFFETPREFEQKLPELYGMVKKMINYRE